MDKIYEQTMLFDFYGELLTEHQRSVYIDAVYNDLSLGEIAEERGISRQGVHDLIRRCDKILKGYEDKLHLVERFTRAKETVREIQELSGAGTDEDFSGERIFRQEAKGQTKEELRGRLRRIGQLSQELLKEL
ncbi:MAG: YlxM family DNA-binding protein [Acetatifactor sp.]|nr:YlxM family DNA-binding protein [Acetatifactor sp.]